MKLPLNFALPAAAILFQCGVIAAQPLPTAALHTPQLSPRDVEFRNGLAIWQGDIIVGTDAVTRHGIVAGTTGGLWSRVNGVGQVPYTVTVTPAGSAIGVSVQNAVNQFNATFAGVIQFVARSADPTVQQQQQANYLTFNVTDNGSSGCSGSSFVGMNGGQQALNIGGGSQACTLALILHEMGHAIGLYHEQSRSDRDKFIAFSYPAVSRGSWGEFDKVAGSQDVGMYDYGSTMHYGRYLFARDPNVPVLETTPPGITIREEGPFSAGDVDVIKRLYGAAPQPVTVTSNPEGLQVIVDGVTIVTPKTFTWNIGSTHALDVAAGVQTFNGATYIFSGVDQGGVLGRWADQAAGAPSAHNITVAAGDGSAPTSPVTAPALTVYSANFIELVPVPAIQIAPVNAGTVRIDPAPVTVNGNAYAIANQLLTLTATPAGNYRFYDWNPTGAFDPTQSVSANPRPMRPAQGAFNFTARFTDALVTTVVSSQPGLSIVVDGNTIVTPKNFAADYDGWKAGSTHSIGVANSPQTLSTTGVSNPWTRFAYANWSDGGAQTHNVTLPVTGNALTVNFTPQYQVSVTASPACAGSVAIANPTADNFYNGVGSITLTATANAGWNFTGWQQDFTGKTSPGELPLNGEKLVAAGFNLATDPLTIASINPARVVAGGPDFTLTVNGSGFVNGASVCIATSCPGNVSVVNGNQISVTVPAASVAVPGSLSITVNQQDTNGCSVTTPAVQLAATVK